jgi:predicted Holliday junction resolvase-like endonuclease
MINITQETLTFVLGIVAIISIIINVYNFIRKPQEKGAIIDARFEEKFKSIDEKFKTVSETIVNLRDNHIHTIDEKLDKHIEQNHNDCLEQAKQMTRIETLLEQIIKK